MAAEQIQSRNAQKYDGRRIRRRLFPLLCLLVLSAGAGTIAHAAINTNATPRGISPAELTTLRTQPLSLLAQFPDGGAPMARYVAQAVASDPRVVPPMLSVANDTSPEQATAMAAGMVRGTRSLEKKQPKTARAIANQVMQSSNLQLRTTFKALGPQPLRSGEFAFAIPEPLMRSPLTIAPANEPDLSLESKREALFSRTDFIDRTDTIPIDTERFITQEAEEKERFITYAAIAASSPITPVIASDAPSNGAVSTSPTQ
jgi:hypothetical protein